MTPNSKCICYTLSPGTLPLSWNPCLNVGFGPDLLNNVYRPVPPASIPKILDCFASGLENMTQNIWSRGWYGWTKLSQWHLNVKLQLECLPNPNQISLLSNPTDCASSQNKPLSPQVIHTSSKFINYYPFWAAFITWGKITRLSSHPDKSVSVFIDLRPV